MRPLNPPLSRPEPCAATPTGPNGVASEMLLSATSSTMFGSATRREVRYRITVGNFGRRATTVTVLDRIPVSRDEGIVVRDISCRPDPQHRTDLGELTWRLPLEPEATAEISLGFRVDTAKGVELRGWRE